MAYMPKLTQKLRKENVRIIVQVVCDRFGEVYVRRETSEHCVREICEASRSISFDVSDASSDAACESGEGGSSEGGSGGGGADDSGQDDGGGDGEDDPDRPVSDFSMFAGDWIGNHWWQFALLAGAVASIFVLTLWPIARKYGFASVLPHTAFASGIAAALATWCFHPWYWHRRLASSIIFAWLGISSLSGFKVDNGYVGTFEITPLDPMVHIAAPLLALAIWRLGQSDLERLHRSRPRG